MIPFRIDRIHLDGKFCHDISYNMVMVMVNCATPLCTQGRQDSEQTSISTDIRDAQKTHAHTDASMPSAWSVNQTIQARMLVH